MTGLENSTTQMELSIFPLHNIPSLPISLSLSCTVCLSVRLVFPFCFSVCLSVCLPACLPTRLFVCLKKQNKKQHLCLQVYDCTAISKRLTTNSADDHSYNGQSDHEKSQDTEYYVPLQIQNVPSLFCGCFCAGKKKKKKKNTCCWETHLGWG